MTKNAQISQAMLPPANESKGDWRWIWIGLALLYLSLIPFIIRVDGPTHGDVTLYYETIKATFSGELPYRDRVFEYPPYALIWFLLPGLTGSRGGFQLFFALQIVMVDILLKFFLLFEGQRRAPGWKGLLPLATYSIGAGCVNFFYLQRLDLIPAALSLLAIVALVRGRYFWSGIWLALGTGTKLYPILFALPLGLLAWRDQRARRFLSGFGAGLAPIVLMSLEIPWWRFLAFHAERGFEVESLYASVFWLANFWTDLQLEWSWVRAWREVKGPVIDSWAPFAKWLLVGSVGFSTIALGWCLWFRKKVNWELRHVCQAMLIPLLPFVVFNIVLSPQYMIWLLVLAAAGMVGENWRRTWPLVLLAVATAVTPVWYPSREFSSGFNLFQTVVLVGRNLVLILVWLFLLKDAWDRRIFA